MVCALLTPPTGEHHKDLRRCVSAGQGWGAGSGPWAARGVCGHCCPRPLRGSGSAVPEGLTSLLSLGSGSVARVPLKFK